MTRTLTETVKSMIDRHGARAIDSAGWPQLQIWAGDVLISTGTRKPSKKMIQDLAMTVRDTVGRGILTGEFTR